MHINFYISLVRLPKRSDTLVGQHKKNYPYNYVIGRTKSITNQTCKLQTATNMSSRAGSHLHPLNFFQFLFFISLKMYNIWI
jgi:hypothetical protein